MGRYLVALALSECEYYWKRNHDRLGLRERLNLTVLATIRLVRQVRPLYFVRRIGSIRYCEWSFDD